MEQIFYTTEAFEPYGVAYFSSVIVMLIIGIFLVRLGKRGNDQYNVKILKGIAFTLSSSIIIWAVIEVCLGRFYLKSDLPLVFCNLIALLLPIYPYNRKKWLFDLLYFLILAGAIQSIITPALKQNYPHYEAFKFWIVHGGLIIFILFEAIKGDKKPRSTGIWTTFLFVQVYLIAIVGVNYLLGSNYLFLNEKPTNVSLLDLLGDWPYYLIVMDVILIPYFLILYSPIWVSGKLKERKSKLSS